MRWSRVTLLAQAKPTGHGERARDLDAPLEEDPRFVVEASPATFRRRGDQDRSRQGYTVVAAGMVVVGVATLVVSVLSRPAGSGTAGTAGTAAAPAQTSQQRRGAPGDAASRATEIQTKSPTAAPATPTAGPVTPAAQTGAAVAAPSGDVSTPRPAPTARPTVVSASDAAASPTAASGARGGRVHVVQHGDTLFSIARRNGTTVDALVTANDLGSPSAVLSVGRQLVIPAG